LAAIRGALAAATIAIAACTSVPLNEPLRPDQLGPEGSGNITEGGYRLANIPDNGTSPEIYVIVTFSGGGTRSAALSLGVLKGLRDTMVDVGGRQRRLLDEIDIISSVSGGSMAAAYYALHRDKIFTDFEPDFLRRDINAEVYGLYLLPWNWEWMFNPHFGTNDAMQRIYDRHMFHGATYADLARRGRPLLAIQATDISFGNNFAFTQNQFDLLCSDLMQIPVARAVAASAGVPVLFSPITLANHADRCGGRRPHWIEPTAADSDSLSRHRFVATASERYLNNPRARYVHLLDGGVSDNLALRGLINAMIREGDEDEVRDRISLKARRLVLISVDGEGDIDDEWAEQRTVGGLSMIIDAMTGTPMNQYNFETLVLARGVLEHLADTLRRDRCAAARTIDGRPCDDVRSYFVQVGLSQIRDPEQRRRLQLSPTALTLPSATIDELIAVGEQQIRGSPDIAAFRDAVNVYTGPSRKTR